MSRLLLVRHAQAQPFHTDPDRLSELGRKQAEALGAWWRRRGERFHEVCCGALLRHRQTLQHALPDQPRRIDPRWNEYDADGVLRHLAPLLRMQDAAFARKLAEYESQRESPDANRYFQAMFEPLMQWWTSTGVAHQEVESWSGFRQRVHEVLMETVAGGRRDVVVVSSGGVIGAIVQMVTGAPQSQALELNWRIRNCSITEIVFTSGRMTLDGFNSTSHLPPDLVTYR